ncbi:hypothetical protein F5Y16DRAFT_46294 [Xylariaceae sp. FL0255]|nr:hypothetical protein F5Y16DRAFT_46294 [Xylariaceae sp. FL0255]
MQADSSEPSLPKKYATTEDWSRLHDVIVQLYVEENKTLDDVKQYMEKEHGFLATVAMYKRQLASWNAFKNLRPDEVLQILRLKKQRDAENKPSVFFVRDRKVDIETLQVYISRNPALHTRLETGELPHPDAQRDVSCHSPSPTLDVLETSQQSDKHKDDISAETEESTRSTYDKLVEALRIYFRQNFESGTWRKSKSYCWNVRGHSGPAELLKSLLDRCMTAALSVGRQVEPVAIRHALDPPFTLLIRVFRNPPPEMVPRILCVAARLELVGRKEIQEILLQFCSDLAHALHGRSHPLSDFWRGLLDTPLAERNRVLGIILTFCMTEFEAQLGASHSLSTEIFLLYFDAVERQKEPQTQIITLQHRVAKIDDQVIDPLILGMLRLESALASCKMHLAEGLFEKAKDALAELDNTRLSPRDDSFRSVWLGYVHWISGDITAAEKAYKDSILAAKRTESRDCVSEALFQLETFYLYSEEPLQAERIRSERFDVLRQLDSIIWAGNQSMSDTGEPRPPGDVTIIRIGSDASSANWSSRAFSFLTGNHRVHHEIPSSG